MACDCKEKCATCSCHVNVCLNCGKVLDENDAVDKDDLGDFATCSECGGTSDIIKAE